MRKLNIKTEYNSTIGKFETCTLSPSGKFRCFVSDCLDKIDDMIKNSK